MDGYDVIVVGGGHNGLTCAVRLALAGARVLVLEAGDIVGGLASNYAPWPGFKAPFGAYVLGLYPRRLMEELGVADRISLIPKDPGMTALLGEGRSLRVYSDPERTAREMARYSELDSRNYLKWDRLWSLAGALLDTVYSNPPIELAELLEALWRVKSVPLIGSRALRMADDLLWSLLAPARRVLEYFFESWEAKSALVEDALVGELASPSTPGTAIIMAHHYLGASTGRRGEWAYVKGGMGALSEALRDRLVELGGRVETSMPAEEIVVDNGRVTGVVAGGRLIKARIVVLATSIKQLPRLASDWLEKGVARRIESLNSVGASAKVIMALRGGPPRPTRSYEYLGGDLYRSSVVIMPGLEYAEKAYQDAMAGGISREPWLSVNVLSTVDPSLAPEGWSLTSVFAQYVKADSRRWGRDDKEELLENVKSVIKDYFVVPDSDARYDVLTPREFSGKGVPGGHIFHISMSPDQLYRARPLIEAHDYKAPWVEGLYIASASSHPGGGVSGLPGYLAAQRILEDLGAFKRRRVRIYEVVKNVLRSL